MGIAYPTEETIGCLMQCQRTPTPKDLSLFRAPRKKSLELLPSQLLLLLLPPYAPFSRLLKPLPNRLDHTRKPVQIQKTQQRRTSQIRERQPGWHGKSFPLGIQRKPDVLIHFDGLIGSPNKTAGSKSANEDDAVDELRGRPGQAEFVHEPVDVEERGGELVEDEVEAVVVYEWALEDWRVSFEYEDRF